ETGHQVALDIRRRAPAPHRRAEPAQPGRNLFLPLETERAGGALGQMFPSVRGPIPKLLARHIRHLAGFSVGATGRLFRSCFSFSNNSARARCSRERTVPIGHPSAAAAAAESISSRSQSTAASR